MGRIAEGVQWFQNAIQRACEDHDLYMLGVACADYGGFCSFVGVDLQVALTHARQGVEFGEKAGGATTRVHAYSQLGQAYLRVGSYAEAVTSLERSRAIVRESHAAFEIEPASAFLLAEAYAYSGDADRALRTAEEAVAGAVSAPLGWSRSRSSPWRGFFCGRRASHPEARSRQLLRNCPDSRGKWK